MIAAACRLGRRSRRCVFICALLSAVNSQHGGLNERSWALDISEAIKGWIFDNRDLDPLITLGTGRSDRRKKKKLSLVSTSNLDHRRTQITSYSYRPFSRHWRGNFLAPFTKFLLLLFFISINLFQGPSIIHLPSREVFPEGKLLWRPAWPRAASDWPSACLPFCILHCLFNKEQSECDFQGRVPVIVALTPCLSNDPHYGASDSSLKGLIYEYAGTTAPQASTHQPPSVVFPPSVRTHGPYIHERGRSHACSAYTCGRRQMLHVCVNLPQNYE